MGKFISIVDNHIFFYLFQFFITLPSNSITGKMKKIITFLLLFAALVSMWSCNNDSVQITEPTNEELIRIVPVGRQLSENLLKTLKSELKAAITEGGFENAVEVCNLKAIPLTLMIEDATEKNITIKRTSFKYRNPENAPDNIEKSALEHFQKLIAENKSLPDQYVRKVTQNNVVRYYYFKPLKVESVCLGCHGNPENMDAGLLNRLSRLYPEDKALGYNEGDFRGLISVIIPE